MERGGNEGSLSINSAVEEFTRQQGLPVHSIASLTDLLQYLDSGADPALSMHRDAVAAYRQRYGV
jgi:orotate phosphoribosyltransferase